MAKKKTTRKKTTARKTTARKTSAKKAPSKKTAKKSTARRSTKKAPARKAPAKKKPAPRKSTTARKSTTKKAPAKKKTASKSSARPAARKAPSRRAAPAGKATTRAKASAAAEPAEAPARPKRKKSPYTKTQLRPMRQALVERRARLLSDLNMMGDEALRAADPEVDSESVADHGTDAYERNLTLGLMEQDAMMLRHIETAFAAIDAGVYGLCSECNEPIPLPRLEALPFANTCVPCQELKEGGGLR